MLILLQTEDTVGIDTVGEGVAVGSTITVVSLIVIALLFMFFGWGIARRSATTPQRSVLEYGNLIVVILGILFALIGAVLILLFVSGNAIAYITAWFGLITGLVGTFFGVKQSADARVGLEKVADKATTPPPMGPTPPQPPREGAERVTDKVTPPPPRGPTPSQPPIVSEVRLGNNEETDNKKPPVIATFSKAMDLTTINEDNFKLVSVREGLPAAPVQGKVTYDSPSKRATFTPSVELPPGHYRASIITGVRDEEGLALARDHTWEFAIT